MKREERLMKLYRKKPVVIEAIQWTGDNMMEMDEFMPAEVYSVGGDQLIIHTLEGDHIANEKDWIVKGIQDEFYPVKPSIFEATYEAVNDLR